jgi:glycosyltransferase involved in cell wall biosynthesis
MKVLWFEVSEPSAYASEQHVTNGWQDSLERIVRTIPEIELLIAFRSKNYTEEKTINGVTYIPFPIKINPIEKKIRNYWDLYVKRMLAAEKQIIEKYNPDIIHIFGTEWLFGLIAAHTNVPVIIHIMGAMIPYNNANYPPGYSYTEKICRNIFSPNRLWKTWKSHGTSKQRENWERKTWELVDYYMGRTQWDASLSRILHPGRRYYHVEEALRYDFITSNNHWRLSTSKKIRLVSTGCSTFWKGPDMMLKVAQILKEQNVDFEWNVAGRMQPDVKKWVESKGKKRFSDCHVNILGFTSPNELVRLLCSSTIYVHTAYIDNSPNAICEAQMLGLPVVSTNVGGISSLVRDGKDGILVPANDPWQMADAILRLSQDNNMMFEFSQNTSSFAKKRHADDNIRKQLMDVYYDMLNKENQDN